MSKHEHEHEHKHTNEHAQPIMLRSESTAVNISIVGIPTAQGVLVNYVTDTSNQPKTFANHIYVWQTTSNAVPWNKTPDGDTALASDSSTGTQQVQFDFEDKGYIIGYAVAPTPKAVCATIFIPQGQTQNPAAWQYDRVTEKVVAVATNLIQSQYHTLTLYTPASNKNWVGVFLGAQAGYYAPIVKKQMILTDAADGFVVIEGVRLLIGTTYTVGYFMVDESSTNGRTSLAASSTFTVGQVNV
jgi:hypothetical protein